MPETINSINENTRKSDKLKVGILGCTGLVGQQFVKMLDGHPYFEVTILCSSRESASQRYGEVVNWIVGGNIPEIAKGIEIRGLSVKPFVDRGIRVVFSALPSAIAKKIERELAGEGIYVFSNASAHRMDFDVPIVIPEVNPDHLELAQAQTYQGRGFIVTNSNCSATGLVLGLNPLLNFGVKAVTVTTYQALSGAGRAGVSSLEIFDNVIPYISEEEEKIERETKKIFGKIHKNGVNEKDLEVNATCCRVPVRDGHLESVVVELEEDVDPGTIAGALSSFRGIPQEMKLPTAPDVPIIVRNEDNRPQPLLDRDAGTPERAKGMAITAGRIRKKGRKANFLLLVHNTIRGAAGTCILDAELAVMKNYIK